MTTTGCPARAIKSFNTAALPRRSANSSSRTTGRLISPCNPSLSVSEFPSLTIPKLRTAVAVSSVQPSNPNQISRISSCAASSTNDVTFWRKVPASLCAAMSTEMPPE